MGSTIQLTAKMGEGFKTDVRVRGHAFSLDEPAPNGKDAGPQPFEALLAALAACTAMTLRSYANHKKIPLDGVDLELSLTRRDPSEVPQGGKTVVIKKKLKFSAAVPADLRQKLLEIAAKCPVNKTLLEGCEISGELA